ncbi:hypothetical protein ABUE31_04775 [Mesorhizobium sp. ZMM04-5]|uniref:Uncharacterized protein n=1 Tax=Mesorhizobium marinum TaxID=3228790 RepID=A0ABV3QY75_9HYPH
MIPHNKTAATTGIVDGGVVKNVVRTSSIGGRTIHLGGYVEKGDAIAAREAAEQEHFGEFAPRKAVAR